MPNLIQIPTSQSNSHYTQTITLSEDTFVLEFRYNTRMARWILSVFDSVGQPIALGLPLLIRRDLTQQYPTLALPKGPLFVIDSSGRNLQPTLGSFLVDHIFYYLDPDA